MRTGITAQMAWLIGFCVLAEAAREVCFKHAADHTVFLLALLKPVAWLGIFFWGVELVAWTVVLEHVPLSIAFPLMALSYVAVVFAGCLVLKEPVNVRQAVGACLITVGVACIGVTGL